MDKDKIKDEIHLFKDDILRFLQGVQVELTLNDNIYHELFYFLKINPRYAMRNRLDKAKESTEKLFELPLELLFSNDLKRKAINEFKLAYIKYIDDQKECFQKIKDLLEKVYNISLTTTKLLELLNVVKVCETPPDATEDTTEE
jgi:hypothetical protein